MSRSETCVWLQQLSPSLRDKAHGKRQSWLRRIFGTPNHAMKHVLALNIGPNIGAFIVRMILLGVAGL